MYTYIYLSRVDAVHRYIIYIYLHKSIDTSYIYTHTSISTEIYIYTKVYLGKVDAELDIHIYRYIIYIYTSIYLNTHIYTQTSYLGRINTVFAAGQIDELQDALLPVTGVNKNTAHRVAARGLVVHSCRLCGSERTREFDKTQQLLRVVDRHLG